MNKANSEFQTDSQTIDKTAKSLQINERKVINEPGYGYKFYQENTTS